MPMMLTTNTSISSILLTP